MHGDLAEESCLFFRRSCPHKGTAIRFLGRWRRRALPNAFKTSVRQRTIGCLSGDTLIMLGEVWRLRAKDDIDHEGPVVALCRHARLG